MTSANTLNISAQGVQYFDGAHTFSGLDGVTSGYVLTSNGTGVAPSFQVNPASADGTQIRSYVSGVSVTSSTDTTITSISLPTGTWDINLLAYCPTVTNSMSLAAGISTTTNSLSGTTQGDNYMIGYGFTSGIVSVGLLPIYSGPISTSIPQYRQVVPAGPNVTYYLVVNIVGGGSITCSGRISAVRVA
jgi:hypothetical protein